MLLRARLVVPLVSSPVENGAVRVAGGRIREVGSHARVKGSRSETVDLGDVILLPGLVNAHTHLDYTNLAAHIPPQRSFSTWIQALVALKASWTVEDYAKSWVAGAQMLLRTGTTLAADVEAVPELLPAMWKETPLRVMSFRELICLRGGDGARAALRKALGQIRGWTRRDDRIGLSPHAPYTTTAELLKLSTAACRRRKWRRMTHVAESIEEYDMFSRSQGPLHDWIGPQRDGDNGWQGSPVQYLERCGSLGDDLLAIHANYLAEGDAALLGGRGAHVAHCPRSHDYFGHRAFPYAELERAGVNICLGTDSLASVRMSATAGLRLSMFAEMATFSKKNPGVSSETILRMATVNGARALGWGERLCGIQPQGLADMIAVPWSGGLAEAFEAVVHYGGEVSASMIHGRWAVPPLCASS